MNKAFAVTAGIMLLCMGTLAHAASMYQITDLGNLGGNTYAYDINNAGQVVGESSLGDGRNHAFVWQNGIMTDLDPFGYSSSAHAINSAGHIAGQRSSTGAAGESRAVLWRDGAMLQLWAESSYATAINDLDQIVGYMIPEPNVFFWQDGSSQPLWSFGGNGRAHDINNAGMIVGSAYVGYSSPDVANLWKDGTRRILGSLVDGQSSLAIAINSDGTAVGNSTDGQGMYAVLWADGSIQDLNVPASHGQSSAEDINDVGQVVGWANQGAFLWENGITTFLADLIPADSPVEPVWATAINDSGQIVGYGWLSDEFPTIHAFLMTPVPEPSGLLALVGGLVVSAEVRRRRPTLFSVG